MPYFTHWKSKCDKVPNV